MARSLMSVEERVHGQHLLRSVDTLQLIRFVLEVPEVADEMDRADALRLQNV